ncbi:MAG: hypothetical protein ACFHXK_06140 [bacterium]
MAYARPGDIVSRRKGLVMHRGVALGGGRVLHNTPFRGEHVCSEREFRAGKRMYITRPGAAARHKMLTRVHADLDSGRGYNLLTNNCEHTVTRVTSGNARSPQLHSWVLGGSFAAAAFALTRHPMAAAAAYAVGRKLSARLIRGIHHHR